MSNDEFDIPKSWGLSPQQEVIIGSLIDEPGKFVSAEEFCHVLYDEENGDKPAPAKLRVLVQRCREIVSGLSDGVVQIESKRGSGWRLSRKHRLLLINLVEA